MIKAIYVFVALAIVAGVAGVFINKSSFENVTCPAVIEMCPDGSYVGPTGSKCEFVCPETELMDEFQLIEEKADKIIVTNLTPYEIITSPITITGEARGYWFFEASFPVFLTNWDGLIIAEGFATAEGDWMTEEFVPFTTTLTFTSPDPIPVAGDGNNYQLGNLILKKDNPSGLPENDDALEIPIRFAP